MNRKMLLLASLLLAFIMGACSKDDGTENAVKMSAMVGGTQWDANILAPTTLKNHKFTITCSNFTSTIVLTTGSDVVGPYVLNELLLTNEFNGIYKASLTATAKDVFAGVVGTLALTKVDTVSRLVSGTFEFKGLNSSLDSVRVSKGVFMNISYLKLN